MYIIALLLPILVFSQNINLDSLIFVKEKQMIIAAHQQAANQQTENNKGKWLNLLPSVSYNATSNSVNVGVSLNSFANYYQLRQRNKLATADLLQRQLDDIAAEKNRLLQMVQVYQEYKSDLALSLSMFAIDEKLFFIKQQEYDNNKIDLVQYLNAKRKFIQSQKSINKKQSDTENKLNTILLEL